MTTLRFHGSAAVLLLPLALFVAVTARLFISEAAFDLTGLAAAGVLTLFSGSLLAKSPSEYWKAAVRGASSELTGTVVHSAEKIELMTRRFEEDGFTSYWL